MDTLQDQTLPGSFMSATGQGNGNAIQEAMARRQMGGGSVIQQNTSTPNGQQTLPVEIPQNAPSAVPQAAQSMMNSMSPQPSTPPAGMQPQGNPEAVKIIDAMNKYLTGMMDVQKAQAGVMK